MATIILTPQEIDFILESLRYTKLSIENHEKHPSYEHKRKKLDEVENVIAKVQEMKKKI